MAPGDNTEFIQVVRDEFSRMRAHLFEATEAAGWPSKQEKGWKGVIRTITYDSQSSIESALRMASNNGGSMAEPGITSAHVSKAYKTEFGSIDPAEREAQAQQQVESQQHGVEVQAADVPQEDAPKE